MPIKEITEKNQSLSIQELETLILYLYKLSNSSEDSVIKAHTKGLSLKAVDLLCELKQAIKY